MVKRIGAEMLKRPQLPEVGDMPTIMGDGPFDKAFEMLKVKSGPDLEIMTRTNARMVETAAVAYNIWCNFHSPYIAGRIDMIMRFAVSQKGKGRTEVVESLKAGAQAVQAEQYAANGNSGYREIEED